MAPRCTTGPSRPALAPEPSDMTVTTADQNPSRAVNRRLGRTRDSMTSATAHARRVEIWRNSTPTTRPPIVGPRKTWYQGIDLITV